jgi:hypothetical protein
MKTRFYFLVALIMILTAFSKPSGASLIVYQNLDDLKSTFINDSDYVMTEFNLKHLSGGSEWFNLTTNGEISFDGKSLTGVGTLRFEFTSNNTTFGATWLDVRQDSTLFKVYGSDEALLDTFVVPINRTNPKGKSLPQFFGIRGNEGELISMVEVELGGATLRDLVHNHPDVPEPGTVLLLGSGVFGLCFLGRKKFHKK